MKPRLLAIALLFLASLLALPAAAFPGFYVGKTDEARVLHSSHIVIMRKGDHSAVTVMPDHEGPLTPFAMVIAVPDDVDMARVKVMRRDFVDRLDLLSAPRFHEFWEMDPCESGKPEQIWEVDRTAGAGSDFLGGAKPKFESKDPPELKLSVDTDFKKVSEYKLSIVSGDVIDWLRGKGYKIPKKVEAAALDYAKSKFLVAEVDTSKVELLGSDRTILSPIRFWSFKPYESIPAKLGLGNLEKHQDIFVYVLHPESRYEAKSYKNVYAPNNITVRFEVKERMGEFYNGLTDMIQKKNPGAFINEYAWPTWGLCGEPCPTEPMLINELLTLGGDVFELTVPNAEKNPKPPELSEEAKAKEKAELDAMKPPERKQAKKDREKQRKELAKRRALLTRHKYIISRLHYRYDAESLPKDVEVGPASGSVTGGVEKPKGKDGGLPNGVKEADANKLQTRYVYYHANKKEVKCDSPKPYRWGKPPRTYRGRSKIWVADDLSRKSRTQIKPAEVVVTPVSDLGLTGVSVAAGGAGPGGDAGTEAKKEESSCGCRTPGVPGSPGSAWLVVLSGAALVLSRRKR